MATKTSNSIMRCSILAIRSPSRSPHDSARTLESVHNGRILPLIQRPSVSLKTLLAPARPVAWSTAPSGFNLIRWSFGSVDYYQRHPTIHLLIKIISICWILHEKNKVRTCLYGITWFFFFIGCFLMLSTVVNHGNQFAWGWLLSASFRTCACIK